MNISTRRWQGCARRSTSCPNLYGDRPTAPAMAGGPTYPIPLECRQRAQRFSVARRGAPEPSSAAALGRGVPGGHRPNRIFFPRSAPSRDGLLWSWSRLRFQSQASTNARLATQAISSPMVSASCMPWQNVCGVVPMAGTIRRFYAGSPGDSFFRDLPLVNDSNGVPSRAKNALIAAARSARMRRPRALPAGRNNQVTGDE